MHGDQIPHPREGKANAWGMPGRGGGGVEASIWLVHNAQDLRTVAKLPLFIKFSVDQNQTWMPIIF